jgi:hypothetical protein
MNGVMAVEDDPSIGFFETARDLLQVESAEGFLIKSSASLNRSSPKQWADLKHLINIFFYLTDLMAI